MDVNLEQWNFLTSNFSRNDEGQEMTLSLRRHLMLQTWLFFVVSANSVMAEEIDPEKSKKILDIFCLDTATTGGRIQVHAEAEADLKKLLFDLGLEGKIDVYLDKYKNVPHGDLLPKLKYAQDCRMDIFHSLSEDVKKARELKHRPLSYWEGRSEAELTTRFGDPTEIIPSDKTDGMKTYVFEHSRHSSLASIWKPYTCQARFLVTDNGRIQSAYFGMNNHEPAYFKGWLGACDAFSTIH